MHTICIQYIAYIQSKSANNLCSWNYIQSSFSKAVLPPGMAKLYMSAYILKAGFQNPQTIWNFPQKDCLRTRKILQFCNMLEIKVKRHLWRPKCVEKSCITCSHNKHTSWFALKFNVQMMHFLDFWLIYALLSSSRFTHFFRWFFSIEK